MSTPSRDRRHRSDARETPSQRASARGSSLSPGPRAQSTLTTPVRRPQSSLFQTPEPAENSSSSSRHNNISSSASHYDLRNRRNSASTSSHHNHNNFEDNDNSHNHINNNRTGTSTSISHSNTTRTPRRPGHVSRSTVYPEVEIPTHVHVRTPTSSRRRVSATAMPPATTPARSRATETTEPRQLRPTPQRQQRQLEAPRTLDRRHPNVPNAFLQRGGHDDDTLDMHIHPPHSPLDRFSSSRVSTPARPSRAHPSMGTPSFHRSGGSSGSFSGSGSGSGIRHSPAGGGGGIGLPLGLSLTATGSPGSNSRVSFGSYAKFGLNGPDSADLIPGGLTPYRPQHMKVIPSPYTQSPATWQDMIPSRVSAPQPLRRTASPGLGEEGATFKSVKQEKGVESSSQESVLAHESGNSLEATSGTIATTDPEQGEKSLVFPNEDGQEMVNLSEMRGWRTDAMHQGLYDTAAFWGDKILAVSEDENDIFWLASAFFQQRDWGRALNLLQKHNMILMSVACKHLAARCLFEGQKYKEALEILGYVNEQPEDDSPESIPQPGIKLEASMCYLRARCLEKIAYMDEAREAYKAALRIDIKCYDAWKWMADRHLLSPKEERKFLAELQVIAQVSKKNAEFVRLCYMAKLQKETDQEHRKEEEETYTQLAKYFPKENVELLLGRAESFYANAEFKEGLEITNRILELDEFNRACIPVHVACMYELRMSNDLFMAAHRFVERHSRFAVAWYAVAVYYFLIENYSDAKRYFSKCVLMDPVFGEAWIGYGHTFMAVGKFDQAIEAYGSASQKAQKIHLGSMFIGMTHLRLMNLVAATRFLIPCLDLCSTDSLLLNEIGVLYYHQGEYEKAIEFLDNANKCLGKVREKSLPWETNCLNLGHCYRQLREYPKAIESFNRGLTLSKKRGSAHFDLLSGLGFVHQIRGENQNAIECYTRAALLRPGDEMVSEMMNVALEDQILSGRESDAKIWARNMAQESSKKLALQKQEQFANVRAKLEKKLATGRGGGGGRGGGNRPVFINVAAAMTGTSRGGGGDRPSSRMALSQTSSASIFQASRPSVAGRHNSPVGDEEEEEEEDGETSDMDMD